MQEFDYVIVGSGSAGCVLALRLAQAGQSVCVLEAGPEDTNPYIHIPAGFIKNITNRKLVWNFRSEPNPATANRVIELTQGRVIGGSSSINGLVHNRGQRADFDSWAARGNTGWSYDEVLPYFKRSETRIGEGDDKYRGRNGPLTIIDPLSSSPLCDMFIEAVQSLGYPHVPDYNAEHQDGVGNWQFNIDPSGFLMRRMSAARAFLRPAQRTGRVTVKSRSPATKILLENRKAVGIRYRAGGVGSPQLEVRARREVLVSAGTLNTPRLLQISGIGPAEHLRSIGVEVAVDLPGVGANLCDHYQLRVAAKVQGIRTINERGRGLPLAWEILKYFAGRPSILGLGPVLMRFFFRSHPALPTPDLQMSFVPASYHEGFAGLLDHYPGMTLGGHKQRPDSRGFVLARSTSIDEQPTIQPNYLSTETDQQGMVAMVKMARRVLRAPAFARHYVDEVFPGNDIRTDDEILDFVRQRGGTLYHHTGTARMGPDGDSGAVLDARLRVRGVQGLRVVDASVMPAPVSGACNAATLMVAEKAADMILFDSRNS